MKGQFNTTDMFIFIARKSSSSGRWRRDPMFCECVSINVLPILCLILKLAEIENLWPVPTISFSPFQTLYFEVSVGACWAPALPATQVQRWDYGSSSFMSHIVMHSCTSLCGPWVWKAEFFSCYCVLTLRYELLFRLWRSLDHTRCL